MIQRTLDLLHSMGMSAMAEAFTAQMDAPDMAGLAFEERLALLVEHEWDARQERRIGRLVHNAHLRLDAHLEDVDYHTPRGLDRTVMRHLAQGEWVRRHHSVLITGPTGVGKTFAACALAQAACRMGYSARYYRVESLMDALTVTKADATYSATLRKLARIDVLVLDDWGLSALGAGEARSLLQVVDDRLDRRSTVIASQLPLERWHGVVEDPTMSDAILDRLVHGAHHIALKGESMRKGRGRRADGPGVSDDTSGVQEA